MWFVRIVQYTFRDEREVVEITLGLFLAFVVDRSADQHHRHLLIEEIDAVLQKVGFGLIHIADVFARRRREDFAREPRTCGVLQRGLGDHVRVGSHPTQILIEVNLDMTVAIHQELAELIFVRRKGLGKMLREETAQLALHRAVLETIQFLEVFRVVRQTIFPFHAAIRQWRIRRFEDGALDAFAIVRALVDKERIVRHVREKVSRRAANVECENVADADFVAMSARQQIDAAKCGARRRDEWRIHEFFDDVETLRADDDGLEQFADRFVDDFDLKAIHFRHHVRRHANVNVIRTENIFDLFANVLIAGVNHRHAVLRVSGEPRVLGEQVRVVQLRFGVAALINAARHQNNFGLVGRIDRARLFGREFARITREQFRARRQRGKVGGKSRLSFGQRDRYHLQAALGT